MRKRRELSLQEIDDKCSEAHRLSNIYQIAFMRGQLHEVLQRSSGMYVKEPRDEYYRLQKHYERLYKKTWKLG